MTNLPILHRTPGTPYRHITDLSSTEAYEFFWPQIEAVIKGRKERQRQDLIKSKHEIGALIFANPQYNRNQLGAKQIIDRVAKDCEVSTGEIYYCIRFYTRCEVAGGLEAYLATLKAGDEATWSQIKKILPRNAPAELPPPKKKRPPGANRASAGRYAKSKVGGEWRQEDQDKLLALLAL